VSIPGKRIAIVTQDPANYGGVLRLVEYIYRRAEAAGLEPEILHYAKFLEHPELHASLSNLFRGELNFWPKEKKYQFRGMKARAIGAWFPEWEPQRLRPNAIWRKALSKYDSFILVTGSAQTGLPLVENKKNFIAWVSSIVEDDSRERLDKSRTMAARLERAGLSSVLRAELKVLQSASRILCVSKDTQARVQKIIDRTTERWPFPIDSEKFRPAANQAIATSRRFLFVGRADDPRKRIELFFAACSALRQIHPALDFSATVVSSADPNIHDLRFRAEWVQNAPDEKLIELYRTSTALVLTSEQEGLGIAAMEAMACGLPVISTRCGGPETFIEDGVSGFFVDDNPESIAKRMFELATNELLHSKVSTAAHKRIENNFGEHVWNQKFENMLQENN